MMQSGNGTAVAAVFGDVASAESAVRELDAAGFENPWLACVKSAPGAETTEPYGTNAGSFEHDVARSSDGVLGTFGRLVSGDGSLRRSLVDHGVPDAVASSIDASVSPDDAVVVVAATDVTGATAILDRCGGDVRGIAGAAGVPVDERDTRTVGVPGQADDLDRGTGRAHSGGGLGATTGFMSDRAARHDIGDDTVDRIRDPNRR